MNGSLDANLFPVNSPYVDESQTSGYMFDYQNEAGIISTSKIRNASIGNAQLGTAVIGTAQIGTLTFNEINGGTATLGGTNNGDGRLVMKNQAGNIFLSLDASGINGTQTGSVNQTGTLIASGAFAQKQLISIIAAGASGGAPTSFFTDSSTPQGLDTSRVSVNPDSFPSNKFYIEAVYRCGTPGEQARTIFIDLYDITGGTPVANGTFSGTMQSGTGYGIYPRERSLVDIRPSMISGNRDYMLRYWGTSTPGTLFVDLYAARLVVDF